ncbi:MAG: glucose-6-phosphate dehydrogenase [Armatimonadetes bacterium]|nr:glucose-6-phosphate dehydrogenase [Armatimonadota bacterium]
MLRARAAEPCVMVIFGASGDLTQRKLIPALFALAEQRLIPPEFSMLGISRRSFTDEEFRQRVKPASVDETNWEAFSQGIFYMSGNHFEDACYRELGDKLSEIDGRRGTLRNRLYYLAVAPGAFPEIIDRLGKLGMSRQDKDRWVRAILEKPFGTDLQSALELNRKIHQTLSEDQIYRIDHYLGKETVQNILAFRFANGIFEPIWNRRYIEHVQITAAESIGIEDRGGYYDHSGALRDMIQNHLLQVLALVGMEPPISFEADAVRDEKGKVLKALRILEPSEVDRHAVRAQYAAGFIDGEPAAGYLQESGVAPESRTETYAAVRFFVDSWRWQGVPFYVRTGKRLPRKVTEVAIQFKEVPHQLFGAVTREGLEPNVLVLRIGPEEGISLSFATKLPGMTTRLRRVNMDFDYGESFAGPSPTAYERLIHDCMIGDATLYNRADAIEAAWGAIQPALDRWSQPDAPLESYEAGSWGPRGAETLIEDTGRYWRKL